ncbi:UPF0426 protein At1g28150, chloroplastic isoform X2 [Daucus carota subsp. sativus]|uniref:Uncharacterized protein n=1 Tax=Daucus carota subsp. sativus TaxID=79200 RepID=A0A166BN48_DAUCS|nr:PREDICTED: UPF0426 protein At1g28150, chloroplastic isoform X2 [Daucus carota subsp. sativus]
MMMTSTTASVAPFSPPILTKVCRYKEAAVYGKLGSRSRRVVSVKASSCNSSDEPILREALKEPVAFLGGLFAGLLRLDLNEDPLKEWISRTVEASGLTAEEVEAKDDEQDNVPEEIEIE